MNELQMIMKFRNDTKWLHENYKEIQKKFENKYVAVKDKDVIDNNKDLQVLIKSLKKKKIDPAVTLIEFVDKTILT